MFMSFNRHDRFVPVSSVGDRSVGAGAAGAGQASGLARPLHHASQVLSGHIADLVSKYSETELYVIGERNKNAVRRSNMLEGNYEIRI
jgi:hypothetical protein